MDDLLKLHYLSQDTVPSALEMSKRAGHLWIFLASPLLASECQIYVHDLARRLGVPVKGTGLADGIEVFPKHDTVVPGDFGMPYAVRWEFIAVLTADSGSAEPITHWMPKSNI